MELPPFPLAPLSLFKTGLKICWPSRRELVRRPPNSTPRRPRPPSHAPSRVRPLRQNQSGPDPPNTPRPSEKTCCQCMCLRAASVNVSPFSLPHAASPRNSFSDLPRTCSCQISISAKPPAAIRPIASSTGNFSGLLSKNQSRTLKIKTLQHTTSPDSFLYPTQIKNVTSLEQLWPRVYRAPFHHRLESHD